MLQVLVVDDDEEVRSSLSEALVREGHQVRSAGDGEQALALLEAHSFDVVISDVRMPRVDGLTLLRRIRLQAPGLAVILMTTFGDISDVVMAFRHGALDYLTKPFDPDDLALCLPELLATRRASQPRIRLTQAAAARSAIEQQLQLARGILT